jgi:hypothetical protein
LYLPTNLDRLLRHDPSTLEAERLCQLARAWTAAHGSDAYGNIVVCGDMNQTMAAVTHKRHDCADATVWERTFNGVGVQRAPACAGIVEETLLSQQLDTPHLVDLYRKLHPLGDEVESHTRSGKGGGGFSTSRIDYILVSDQNVAPGADCWTQSSGESTDHCTVLATVPLLPRPSTHGDDADTGIDANVDALRPPHARGLTDGQRRACALAVEAAVSHELPDWIQQLDRVGEDPARTLGLVQAAITLTLRNAVAHILPRGPPRGRLFMSAKVRRLRRGIRSACAVRAEVRRRTAARWTRWDDTRWKRAVQKLGRSGATCPTRTAPSSEWQTWASETSPGLISRLRTSLHLETAAMRNHPRFREANALDDSRSMGDYMAKMASGCAENSSISSAIDPETNERVYAPKKYVPIVRGLVMDPFQTCHDPPDYDAAIYDAGPCKGLCRKPDQPGKPKKVIPTNLRPVSPGVCHDARCTGCKPEWWDRVYYPRALVDPLVFANLMAATSIAEVLMTLRHAPAGKASGLDLTPIDLLKIVVEPSLLTPVSVGLTVAAEGVPVHTSCLLALVAVTNFALEHSCSSAYDNLCWTAVIPKPDGNGGKTRDADRMRPLMVSTEIYKIRSRVLAARLGDILLQNPHILSPAQRGFLRDGDAGQPVTVVLDVLEDFAEHRYLDGDGTETLSCILYDQRKAYDRVQRFALAAALRRLRLPEQFVTYVLSSMNGTRSSVRTKHGLTDEYDVLCGVRQGCPLAPLLYLIFIDPLLRGLENLPNSPPKNQTGQHTGTEPEQWDPHPPGYRFFERPTEVVAVTAYADDTTALELETGQSSVRTLRRHEWVRAWLGANLSAINTDKCVYYSHGPADAADLLSVDGRTLIPPTPCTTTSRLLGVYLSPMLDWNPFLKRLNKKVSSFCGMLDANKPGLEMAVHAINSYLLPRLETGLRFLPLTPTNQAAVKRWDTRIRASVLRSADLPADARYPGAALRVITDLQMPSDMHWIIQTTELTVTLNSWQPIAGVAGVSHASPDRLDSTAPLEGTPSARTTWLRMSASTRTPMRPDGSVDHMLTLANSEKKTRLTAKARSVNRLSSLLQVMQKRRVTLKFNPSPWFAEHTEVAVHSGATRLPLQAATQTWLAQEKMPPSIKRLFPRLDVAFVDAPALVRMPLYLPTDGIIPCQWISHPDGSTAHMQSGFAAVATTSMQGSGRIRAVLGRVKARGHNYCPEKTAAVGSLILPPVNSPESVRPDCQAGVWAVQGSLLPPAVGETCVRSLTQRGRNRSAARPISNTERKMVSRRRGHQGAATHWEHVRAHTGRDDDDSHFNDLADWLCNAARRHRASGQIVRVLDVTYNDELVLVYTKPFRFDKNGDSFLPKAHHVDGDVRKALKRLLLSDLIQEWAAHDGMYGSFARDYGSLLGEHCKAVRQARVPGALRASLLVLSQAYALLPPGVTGRHCKQYPTSWHPTDATFTCPLCHSGEPVNARHMMLCPAVALSVADTCTRAHSMIGPELCRPWRSATTQDHTSTALWWAQRARSSLITAAAGIGLPRLDALAHCFVAKHWTSTAEAKPGSDDRNDDFREDVFRSVTARVNSYSLSTPWQFLHHCLPPQLMRCLVRTFQLSTEAFANSCDHHSRLLPHWFSVHGSDRQLGAELDFLHKRTVWEHRSIWANPPITVDGSDVELRTLLRRARLELSSCVSSPVRLLVVVPERMENIDLCNLIESEPGINCRHVLSVPARGALMSPPEGWPHTRNSTWTPECALRLLLFTNDASELADPIDWPAAYAALAFATAGLPTELCTPPPEDNSRLEMHHAHGWLEAPPSWGGRTKSPVISDAVPRHWTSPWRSGSGAMVHFFDPRCSTRILGVRDKGVFCHGEEVSRAYMTQHAFDRLAGLAGVLPRGIQCLLSWKGGSRKNVDSMCSGLRKRLLLGMVRTIKAYQTRLGDYLAHAAPRDFLLCATIESKHAARHGLDKRAAETRAKQARSLKPAAAETARQRALAATHSVSAHTRSKVRQAAGRAPSPTIRTGVDASFWWGAAATTEHVEQYFRDTRWQSVRLVARAWRARLPASGPCHIDSVF